MSDIAVPGARAPIHLKRNKKKREDNDCMKRKGAKLENTVNWVASVIGGVSLVGMVVLIS